MKTILYHGQDPDFYKELKAASEVLSDCEVHQSSPGVVSLIEQGFILKPHIIFLDASYATTLTEEVRWMKTTSQFRPTLITAICKDEQEVKESENLLSAGVNLFHLTDADSECFLQDCFKIAFGTRRMGSEFAQAKNLEIPFSVGFISSLAGVGRETFLHETDLELSESVSMTLPMSVTAAMEITGATDGGVVSPFLKTYEVKYPFSGPWDTMSENSLQPETVETWIGLRNETFDQRKRHLCLFTQDEKFIRSIPRNTAACWYQIFGSSEEASGRLYQSKPGVVFFDLPGLEGPDLKQLTEIVRALREIESKPMLVIFGSKSDSMAMRKIFDYEFILSVPAKLDLTMFLSFEKAFLAKSTAKEEMYFLKPNDEDRTIVLDTPVILTSITERNITFLVNAEIPFYSIARIELPLPAYVTIVPSEKDLPASRKGNHYAAIIHGISEENLAHLRKIVNQLIYKPVSTLTKEQVEIMLKQDYVQKTPKDPPPTKEPTKIEETDPGEVVDARFSLKKNLKGKSKL